MEIKQMAIVVKLDSEEKETLEKAFRIVTEIYQNELIQDNCSTGCPFKRYCQRANCDQDYECLLESTLFNLKEIMNNV